MKKQVSENPVKNRDKDFTPLVVVAAMLIACYLTSNLMAVKLIRVFDITVFDAGTIIFPLAYMLGDVLTEVWGFKVARKVIILALCCNIFLVVFTSLGSLLPYPDYMTESAEAYATVFGIVPRILAASLIAFLAGELSNSYLLVYIKGKTKGRHLWIRTIGSSVVGHLLDTVIFVLIAFLGTTSAEELFSMIFVQYFVKLGIEAVCATPISYAAVNVLKKYTQDCAE